MQFKSLIDVITRIRLLLSPALSDYKLKPAMKGKDFVVWVEVPPSQFKKATAILPKKIDGIDILVISSLL